MEKNLARQRTGRVSLDELARGFVTSTIDMNKEEGGRRCKKEARGAAKRRCTPSP